MQTYVDMHTSAYSYWQRVSHDPLLSFLCRRSDGISVMNIMDFQFPCVLNTVF